MILGTGENRLGVTVVATKPCSWARVLYWGGSDLDLHEDGIGGVRHGLPRVLALRSNVALGIFGFGIFFLVTFVPDTREMNVKGQGELPETRKGRTR